MNISFCNPLFSCNIILKKWYNPIIMNILEYENYQEKNSTW